MGAEADQSDGAEREQAEHGRECDLPAFAPARGREHEERQHEAGADLDAHADDERRGGRTKARAGPGGERQRGGEHHHDQRVVVRAADRQHEQDGVQPEERGGPATRVSELAGGARDEGDRREARGDGERLERPQAAGEAERGGGVAGEREQRPVGRMLVGPADEPEDFVAGGLGGDVRVRVQAVQRSQASEAEVAEHVLGDQRRPQQQDRVRGEDRRDDRAHRQRARARQHEQVAGAHDQRQRLKGPRAEAHAQAFQRAGHPAGPATAAPRHVLRRFPGSAGDGEEGRHDDARQAEQAECARNPRGAARGRAPAAAQAMPGAGGGVDRHARQGRGGRHRLIVTSRRQAGV
jgi:hypothetical protein